jgi:hypothetical protein
VERLTGPSKNLQKDTKRAVLGAPDGHIPCFRARPGRFAGLWVKSAPCCAKSGRIPFLKEIPMSAPHAAPHDAANDAPHDVVEEIVPMMPIVLPIAGAVLMFLLAFIAVSMA